MLIHVLHLSIFSVLRLKKLYDDCFRQWKKIPLHLFGKYFGSSFKFHSKHHLEHFQSFYKQMQMNGEKYFIRPPITTPCILSQFLWYNSYIKIDNKAAY